MSLAVGSLEGALSFGISFARGPAEWTAPKKKVLFNSLPGRIKAYSSASKHNCNMIKNSIKNYIGLETLSGPRMRNKEYVLVSYCICCDYVVVVWIKCSQLNK